MKREREAGDLGREAKRYQAGPVAPNRYPVSFREKVAKYTRAALDGGERKAWIERSLGIPWVTLERWLERHAAPAPTALVPVRMPQPPEPLRVQRVSATAGLRVTSPSGYRLEGLALDDAVEVMRRLA
jgi:hypothetical protein